MAEPDAIMVQGLTGLDGQPLTPDQHVFTVGPRFAALPGFAPGDQFLLDMSLHPRDGDAVLANVSDLHGHTETVLRRFTRGWLVGNMAEPMWVDDVRVRVMGTITRRWWSRDGS